jgi:serine/threonine-protein kinase
MTSEPQLVNALLRRLAEDRAEGRVRALADYQAAFPGNDALVAEVCERCAATGSDGPHSGRRGERIGPFTLIRELGRGGQGVVHLAEDTRLGRRVAIKVLNAARALDPDRLERLLREARISSRLDHPGICAVHEAGVEAGAPYIVMSYVEGTTLARKIASARRAPDRAGVLEAVAIVEKVARALHAAHEAGIVHRDVKPGNVIVTPSGDPVILDFGFAREDESDLPALTRSGDVFGTPAYMSPEQLTRHGPAIDRRTDVWSLGVCLYEIVTSRRPFDAPTREGLGHAILTDDPTPPRRLSPSIPKDLAVVIDTALRKEPDRRYRTAEALAEDLRAVRENRPVAAKPVGPFGRAARWAARERAKAALLAAVLVAVPVVSVLVALRIQDAPRVRAQRQSEIMASREELVVQGYTAAADGDFARSAARFQEAVALDPSAPDAIIGLAFALGSSGLEREALRVLDHNAAFVADRRAAVILRNDRLRGVAGKAAPVLAGPLPSLVDPLDHYLEGIRLYSEASAGRRAPKEALASHLAAILLSPAPRLLFYVEAARCAEDLRDEATMESIAQALLRLWPGSPTAHAFRGSMFIACNRLDEAAASWRTVLAMKDDYPHAHYNLGIVLTRVSRVDEAMAEFENALRIDPNDADARYNLAVALGEKGRIPEALEQCRTVLASKPRHFLARSNFAAFLLLLGHVDEAVAEFEAACALDPKDALSRCNLGRALAQKRLHARAAAAFQEAIRLDPGLAHAHEGLGSALWSEGFVDEAIAKYREAIRIAPSARTWGLVGRALADQRRFQESLEALTQSHEIGRKDPAWDQNSEAWIENASPAAEQERRLEAIVATGEMPDDPADLPGCAELMLRRGKPALAAKWYRTAYEADASVFDDLAAGHRFRAACAAAASGCGRSEDPALSEADRAAWRALGLAWLIDDLTAWRRAIEVTPSIRGMALQRLTEWTVDPALAAFRDPVWRESLPEGERGPWSRLLAEAEAVRASVQQPAAALPGTRATDQDSSRSARNDSGSASRSRASARE